MCYILYAFKVLMLLFSKLKLFEIVIQKVKNLKFMRIKNINI